MFFKLIFICWGYKYLIGFVAITAYALLQILENNKENGYDYQSKESTYQLSYRSPCSY